LSCDNHITFPPIISPPIPLGVISTVFIASWKIRNSSKHDGGLNASDLVLQIFYDLNKLLSTTQNKIIILDDVQLKLSGQVFSLGQKLLLPAAVHE